MTMLRQLCFAFDDGHADDLFAVAFEADGLPVQRDAHGVARDGVPRSGASHAPRFAVPVNIGHKGALHSDRTMDDFPNVSVTCAPSRRAFLAERFSSSSSTRARRV